MKKLLVAALMVVLATPAFAAIQNVKVSGDITSTYLDRDNFDLGTTVGSSQGFKSSLSFEPEGLKRQSVFITQTRVRVDADLSDNVSTTVGLINERAWNGEYGNNGYYNTSSGVTNGSASTDALDTNVQLYLASVTMREFLYSPLTITVGRQVFNYGNGLIMGDGGVNNLATGNLQYIAQDLTERTSYDGIKAILDYKPLTIDMFYFKYSQNLVNGNPISDNSSSDVYGINLNYQLNDPMNTVFETYMFSNINGNQAFGTPTSTPSSPAFTPFDKGNTLFVPGLRASTNPIKGLNVQGEVAWQLGQVPTYDSGSASQVAVHRDAMAYQFLASYALPVLDKYKPSVNAAYTYVSGDKDQFANHNDVPYTSAKTDSAWAPFNENQGSGTIYNTLFPLSNMNILALGASVNPLEDVTASFTWSGLWAAESFGTYNPLFLIQPDGGNNTISPANSNKRGLGNESDVNVTYNYTEDVTFGVSLGWFVPGDAFTKNNRDTASQAIASVGVKF